MVTLESEKKEKDLKSALVVGGCFRASASCTQNLYQRCVERS